jgi:hypothetical protein
MGSDAMHGGVVIMGKSKVKSRKSKVSLQVLLALSITAAPAFAQSDLSGTWAARNQQEQLIRGGSGPRVVDYTGVPLSDEGRAKALAWSPGEISMLERQCLGYSQPYMAVGPFGLKIWEETDPATGATIAWKIGAWEDRGTMTIWMDGRPHPSALAPHDHDGFTTGVWSGDRLTAFTTHMRAGYLRRNGAPLSDQATLTMHFLPHGNLLTIVAITEDPVYLSEPHIETKSYERDGSAMRPIGPPCVPGFEGASGEVPHFLPGKNPFVDELTKAYGVPADAVLGRAETLYPDYRKKMRGR